MHFPTLYRHGLLNECQIMNPWQFHDMRRCVRMKMNREMDVENLM